MNNDCKSMTNNSHNNRPINPFAIHFIHAVSRPTPPSISIEAFAWHGGRGGSRSDRRAIGAVLPERCLFQPTGYFTAVFGN